LLAAKYWQLFSSFHKACRLKLAANIKPTVIFLMGPTASGKTALAIALSARLPIDVISVDSALIYREMNIGTAKPTAAELGQTPHSLIDICDPSEAYSAADFCRDAQREITQSHQAKRIPLLVGGTMMYFNALLKGLADMPATDDATRQQLEVEAALKGWPALHAELQVVDADAAEQIHPNHSQRIARALAVYRMSGKTMTTFREEQQRQKQQGEQSEFSEQYDVVQLALIPQDRAWLHERIQRRYGLMLAQGFIEEVKRLYAREDLHADLPSMRAVGYRQVWEFLAGKSDYDTMIEKAVAATRQLAKRQLTWLRGWENLHVLDISGENATLEDEFEKNLNKALNFLRFTSI
jgi:tRNA dimethylallyltransferase